MVSGALGISYDIETKAGTISPRVEGRYANVDLEAFREDGGTLALAMRRQNFRSTQARFGFDYQKKGKLLTLDAHAQMVWEFEKGPTVLFANFAQGVGGNAAFRLRTADTTWGEVGASATFGKGPFTITGGFDTTIGRQYADAQVFRGTATYRF
jgi:outer membrane autotransporter protein